MKKTKLGLLLVSLVLLFSAPLSSAAGQTQTCPTNSSVAEILNQVDSAYITKWIRDFSGEDFVAIGGAQRRILTRQSLQLFNFNANALAYPYLGELLRSFGYEDGTSLADHLYTPTLKLTSEGIPSQIFDERGRPIVLIPELMDEQAQAASWKNKIVILPGHGAHADELVLMTAHMDSTSGSASTNAPGAEDNASGIAALMEAARLFRFYRFDRTIKIIFFSGEEQGLLGSEAYVDDFPAEMDNIIGVVNLDMFGYDADNDRCFELHVGTRADSNQVGTCFTDVIDNYALDLSYDYVTSGAIPYSDHASFWYAQVGAIEVLENSFYHSQGGCGGIVDENRYYHTVNDRITHMNMPVTLAIAQGGIGTTASLAGTLGRCFAADPVVSAVPQAESVLLSWDPIEGADVYRVYRGTAGCDGSFNLIAETADPVYEDRAISFGTEYVYQVQAAEEGAVCFSQLSNCAATNVPEPPEQVYYYLPFLITAE
ncbi:MAG TPA: M28 family metallopeptidase [Anaerolineaceae bacterium]|nr:M28 family metallopeptidase [Anaerolineaceae bacterium]